MPKVYFATCDGTQRGRVTGYHLAAEIDETEIPTIQTETGPKREIPVN